jgi:hypothetical protein
VLSNGLLYDFALLLDSQFSEARRGDNLFDVAFRLARENRRHGHRVPVNDVIYRAAEPARRLIPRLKVGDFNLWEGFGYRPSDLSGRGDDQETALNVQHHELSDFGKI